MFRVRRDRERTFHGLTRTTRAVAIKFVTKLAS